MAREVQRRPDIAARIVTVDIEDDFGVISHHSIPLMGDKCLHCGFIIPGTQGSPNVEASIAAALAHVDAITDEVIGKLEPIAHTSKEIQQHIERAKANRNGHRAPGHD